MHFFPPRAADCEGRTVQSEEDLVMKHTKILIAVVLLFSLLLSSCGMAAAQLETIEIETEPERAVITMAEPAPARPKVQL